MTDRLPVSLIVVSRHRRAELARCIAAIRKLDHPNFELIVVADPAAAQALAPALADAKVAVFDEPNISAARNAGLRLAAGQIVAFIDDDAVPEPRWLLRLTAPFADPRVAAAGGYVIGRNGISFQWKAAEVDANGQTHPIVVDETRWTIPAPGADRAIKTEGTNCAFRRDLLTAMGGFDPALRFYLDEADVNMRLARAGHATAIVPNARVHHGYAASERRRADRVPTDLSEIAASQAVFLRKHAPADDHAEALAAFGRAQEDRILSHLRAGRIEAAAAARLRSSLEEGLAEGRSRLLAALPAIASEAAFRRLAAGSGECRFRCGWTWRAKGLRAAARSDSDATTVLFLFSPTALYHSLRFTGTHWEQRGGLFGRSDRADSLFRLWTRKRRVAREIARADF